MGAVNSESIVSGGMLTPLSPKTVLPLGQSSASIDLNQEDPYGYRVAMVESFLRWGIHPAGIRSTSVWQRIDARKRRHPFAIDVLTECISQRAAASRCPPELLRQLRKQIVAGQIPSAVCDLVAKHPRIREM